MARSRNALLTLVRGLGNKTSERHTKAFRRKSTGTKRGIARTVCVIVAFGIWVLLSLDDEGELRVELQTSVVNQAENQAFVEAPATSVMATVRGTLVALTRLRFNPPEFTLDAAQDVVQSQNAVDWPAGITGATFDSPQIPLLQDVRVERAVPIRSRVSVGTALAYALFEDPVLEPDSVVISGADTIVQSIDAWQTAAMRRVGIKDSLTFEVALVDSLPGLVSLSHESVHFSAMAHNFTEGTRSLRVGVRDIPNADRLVELEPTVVTVRFHAPLSEYQQVTEAGDFEAYVSYETIRQDTTGIVVPQVVMPNGLLVTHVSTEPQSVRYFINTGLQ